jgi:hypothetical protein
MRNRSRKLELINMMTRFSRVKDTWNTDLKLTVYNEASLCLFYQSENLTLKKMIK